LDAAIRHEEEEVVGLGEDVSAYGASRAEGVSGVTVAVVAADMRVVESVDWQGWVAAVVDSAGGMVGFGLGVGVKAAV
jgi:hypothetical protein